MAMPTKVMVMVTPTIRMNMPKEGTTTTKHMAMVTTTKGRITHRYGMRVRELTKVTVTDTTPMATVPKGPTPPMVPRTAKDTPMEDIMRLDTKTMATSIMTRATANTHGVDVVTIPRRTPKLSAISR